WCSSILQSFSRRITLHINEEDLFLLSLCLFIKKIRDVGTFYEQQPSILISYIWQVLEGGLLMGNVRFSLLLLVLMLVAVGCDIGATPDKAADTERPVVTMAIEETKQPEKPIETLTERPIEEEPVETPTEQRLTTEAIRHAYPPEEMPSVTESFRLPFALDVEEDAIVYVQKVGSTEVFELTSDQT